MTYTPKPDLADVLRSSSFLGPELNWTFTVPEKGTVTTSGSGVSSSTNAEGTQLDAGTTSGDEISADSWDTAPYNLSELDLMAEVIFNVTSTDLASFTDRLTVGLVTPAGSAIGDSIFYDPLNGQYNVAGTTATAPTATATFQTYYLKIYVDQGNDQTTFWLQGAGIDDKTTVSNSKDILQSGRVRLDSNGGDDVVIVSYTRSQPIPAISEP